MGKKTHKQMSKSHIIYVRLKEKTHEALKEIAKVEKETKSAVARDYIERGVKRNQTK